MMESLTFKRWTIPNTEITIQRVEKGPRSGEHLFTAETVERVPEFYERMKGIQYLSVGHQDGMNHTETALGDLL